MMDRLIDRQAAVGLAAALLSIAIAGCASLPADTQPAVLPVTSSWPADAPTPVAGDAIRPTELPWRDYFVQPQLQALIETALANNRDLRIALLRVEEARAAYAIHRSDQFPAIGVGGQAIRARVPGDLNPSGQSLTSGEYRAEVGLSSWELDLWGRVRSLKEAALQQYLATDVAWRAVNASLIAEVANGYLGLRELDERVALARQTVATREETLRIFRRRNAVGSTSALDLTQVETLSLQARALLTQLEKARAAQAHALTVLLGTPVELPPVVDADTQLRDHALFAEIQAGLPADLLTARPDIAAAEHRLAASHASILAARAAFFPRIALTGAWGTASADLDGLFDSGSRAWSFVPTISLPIFDGRRRRAGLELAQVRSEIAVADYEKTVQNAFREVADALSARHWLSQQVEIQRQALDTQTRRVRLAQLRYDSGAAAYLEVLDAQRDLLAAQHQFVQVRRSLLASHIALYVALGGGATEPTSSTSLR